MFARLFDSRLSEAFANDSASSYYESANTNATTLPNMLLAGNGTTDGLDNSIIQTINEVGQRYKSTAIPQPDKILRNEVSPDLSQMAAQCHNRTLNQLIASQDPDTSIHCGWLYTKPPQGSPIAVRSTGFLGTDSGPIRALNPPQHQRWFFDLDEAKQETLLDKCNALKTCTDVDSVSYKGDCGYCLDTYQGVPIDSHGNALYPSHPRGSCSSIARSSSACPPPPPPDAGPQPLIDRTCDPINGQLSRACMKRQVMSAGCSDSGALALALSGGVQNHNDYVYGLRNSDTVKVYNRMANPPINLDIFSQGRTTIDAVLQEVRQIKGNTALPANSGVGAAARDMCLRRGLFDQYDICSELSDGVPTPLPLKCLQNEFLKIGGTKRARKYPTAANMTSYNSMGSLGAIKQYWNSIIQKMGTKTDNYVDYNTQKTAMDDMLGIKLEEQIKRAPYSQGVEVFWFVLVPGNASRVIGLLKRTIEPDIVQLRPGASGISQLGGLSYGCMMQLTDLRAQEDFTTKFSVNIDDGFWIAVNQPANIDRTEMVWGHKDVPGLFRNNNMQGPTWYTSTSITPFRAATPNIIKMFFQDGGGGWNSFLVDTPIQSGPSGFTPQNYSLTCEERAPFLCYEVSPKSQTFEEQRNPGLFGQFLNLSQLEPHLRPEEAQDIPGKKQFVRLQSSSSYIDIPSIAFQCWKTMTFLVRFATMPIKETILTMLSGGYYCNLIANNGGAMSIEHNFGGTPKIINVTQWGNIQLNRWLLFIIHNNGTGVEIFAVYANDSMPRGWKGASVQINNGSPFYSKNATWNPAPGQNREPCSIVIGPGYFTGKLASTYSTSAFQFDVGWVHFFDYSITQDDMKREANANWIYTPFPSAYDTYS
jgi:hypothetical protein